MKRIWFSIITKYMKNDWFVEPVKKVFEKNRTQKKKSTENTFSKEDMDSLVLGKVTVNKVSGEPIFNKKHVQEKTEKEFVKRVFVKPVFVNKKYTDEGAAF